MYWDKIRRTRNPSEASCMIYRYLTMCQINVFGLEYTHHGVPTWEDGGGRFRSFIHLWELRDHHIFPPPR